MPDTELECAMSRKDWLAAADGLLAPLEQFRSASGALIALPGRASWSGERSDALEGFARSFLLLALRVAGSGDPHGLLARYREGLLAGTDAQHEDAWPLIESRGQALVEAASIVIALDLTRELLWDTLDRQEQQRVATWLAPSAWVETPPNNWVLFRLVIQEFLAVSGFGHDDAVIDTALSRWNAWYDGEGWFRDGDRQSYDYYNAWAMHVYPWFFTRMHARRDAARAAAVAADAMERLREFLAQHVLFFGADGTPVYVGRSLIYRFGALAPLWIGELEGVSPLAPGALRRLTSRTLRRFLDGGALDERGLLTSGWLGAFPPMVQAYSGPASPYWSSSGFLGLLLPPSAPVWVEPESTTPVERDDTRRVMRAPGFLLSSTAADGIVRLVNHGSDNYPPLNPADDPHYSRLAYSSATAPSFDPGPVDNHIALLDAQGRPSRRGVIHRLDVTGEALGSQHRPFWLDADDQPIGAEGVTITTVSVVDGAFVVHVHIVDAEAPVTAPLRVGGYAITDAEGRPDDASPTCARVSSATLESALHALSDGLRPSIARGDASSPCGGDTRIPALSGVHRGTRSVHVVAAELRGADTIVPSPPRLSELAVEGDAVRVTIAFDSGASRALRISTSDRTASCGG